MPTSSRGPQMLVLLTGRVVGPQRKKTRHDFLDIREAIFGLSHFVDVSPVTMLALEQVL